MAKILVVVPNEQMVEQAKHAITEMQIDAEVACVSSKNVLEIVNNSDALVVVARGNHAHLIKSQTNFPLVEIILSGQELAILIDRAIRLSGREHPHIALVGFYDMFSDPQPFAKILGAKVSLYYATSSDDIPRAVEQAAQEYADVIVGGEIAMEHAAWLGIRQLFLESSGESMRSALMGAKRVLFAIEMERRRSSEFMSLLNYSFDAILKLDAAGNVLVVNYMAEKIFRKSGEKLAGESIFQLLNILEESQFYQAIKEKKSIYSTVVRTEKESFVANLASLQDGDEQEGFILTMQEFHQIDDMEETVRSARFGNSLIAHTTFNLLTTKNLRMGETLADAQQFAQYDLPVLITGPYGTPKLELAEAIHNASLRREQPFVHIDLSGFSAQMQTAQLLGGIRTDGERFHGALEKAYKGTLFIEHIELLEKEQQVQVLSVLRNGSILRADGRQMQSINARLICSADKPLEPLVQAGEFSEVLYRVLMQLTLNILSLSKRKEDIPQLINTNMAKLTARYKKFVELTQEAQRLVIEADWQGNEMELAQFLERVILAARDKIADVDQVKRHLPQGSIASAALSKRHISTADEEEARIRFALDSCDGRRQEAADLLNMSKATLWRRMKQYGLK